MPSNWPSRACFTCRRKKVKCDETSPSCQRCLKSGAVCPGYRPVADLVFRDQSKLAKLKVEKRVKIRTAERDGLSGASSSVSSSPDNNFEEASLIVTTDFGQELSRISPPMSTNWRDIAVPRFFADYIFQSRLLLHTSLSFLPELYGRTNMRAPLREAVDAVACLSLSNQLGIKWLKTDACKFYCSAVEQMARLLQDPVGARQDAALATNYLFGLFELISGFKLSGITWSRYRHHPGRVMLMQLRGKDQFATPMGINIFRVCMGHVAAKCIAEHLNPTEETEMWLETMPVHDPGLQFSKCSLRTARFCYEAQVLFDNTSENEWWIVNMLQVIKKAILNDLEYQEWSESLPSRWRPRIPRKSGTTSMEEANGDISSYGFPTHVYEDIYVAWIWNNYRASRIHLHEVLLRCVSLIETHRHAKESFDIERTRKQSRAIISELITDLCSSASFCLGDIDSNGDPAPIGKSLPLAGYLSWVQILTGLLSSPAESQQELWLESKLKYIANTMGVQAAQTVLDRGRIAPWDLRTPRPRWKDSS